MVSHVEKQLALEEERVKLCEDLAAAMPDLWAKEFAVVTDVFDVEGRLGKKVKRLLALAIALGIGCTNCILFHTLHALEAGATKEDFLELIGVEITMRGTSGIGESLRMIRLLQEKGVW